MSWASTRLKVSAVADGSQSRASPRLPIVERLKSNRDKGRNNVNLPLPSNLKPAAPKTIFTYASLNSRMLPYHGTVHNNLGGQMPNPDTSPSDPISWPFHAFLVAVYEQWRGL